MSLKSKIQKCLTRLTGLIYKHKVLSANHQTVSKHNELT